ncbi:Vesicle-mediated ER to Golgi transport protein [Kalmusia sp. IMI 367209]|nr:Vesicle-mediated ER to Golgi transport protein [Kalmusia sp. IMI 367209]
MLRMLEAQAPAKQTATDTISTLSGRLQSATLLEDRRAAILGLRSFAKEYPASVASGALRGLIAALTKDAEDVDTIKVVLETLLMLFNPNEHSPEASDEIALWLADEFTQRQDNITILLELLDTPDFYSRLYSLQLIRAISDARPERTQECVLTGVGRLVATLDDPRDAVRTEGLVLLNDLSRSSPELQKVIVFADAFDKIFNLIHADGSLTQGTIVVQDCLSLLANLVRFNTSNQTHFRETGGVLKLAALLPGAKKPKKARSSIEEEDDWVSPQADKNLWGLLAILRMFLVRGSISTLPNQVAFQKHGILQQVVNMAFDPTSAIPIKIESLNACADMIRGNARLQEGFAQLQVRPIVEPVTNGTTSPNVLPTVYMIDALLDLALTPAANDMFDVRFAACECIKAYFFNHLQIRTHFLKRAIGGHVDGGDETANALTTLLSGPQGSQTIDPYRTWFAAVILFHLVYDDHEAKNELMQVVEGDAESGEEVVTCIQTLTGNLIASLQLGEDERIPIAYLMLLSGWLFEDAAAVNDFLGEASSLQSLVQAVNKPGNDHIVVRGLCAALLGIIYEFSTKDSPVPRRDLQPLLTTELGREKYLNAIAELRHHPDVRDFEVIPQAGPSGSALPNVFFDESFVDFLKDNFSRLSRAIDRNPVIEIHQSHDGIDRDLVDSLRGQLDEKSQAIEKLQADLLTLDQKLNQEQADHRKTQESSLTQVNTIKRINEDLHRNHENDVRKLEREHKQAFLDLENRHNLQVAALNNKVQQATRETSISVAKTKQEYEQKLHDASKARTELDQRLSTSERLRQESDRANQEASETERQMRDEIVAIKQTIDTLQTRNKESESQIEKLKKEKDKLQTSLDKVKSENQDLKTKIQDQTWKVKDAEEKLRKAEAALKEKEEARASVQTELDDLFVVLGDLEEKRTRDKQRLKELGEEISEAEDDDDGEDGDEDEDEDEDDED